MTRWMKFFAVVVLLPALLALAACGPGLYGAPRSSSTIVTDDPSKLPDMSWQTAGQRQILMSQNQRLAQQPAPLPEPTGTAVKVAVLVPLSGKNAALGQAMLNAAQLALYDVGNHGFELIPADTGGTPQGAATAAQRAVSDGANLILGPIFADGVRAVRPVADAARVPMIAFTTDWSLADNNTYIFGFLPSLQAERVAAYAQSRGLSRLAVIAPQTDYANLIVTAITRSAAPVATLRYTPGQLDLGQQVAGFVAQNKAPGGGFAFDSVLLPLGGESLRSLTAQLDQYGIRPTTARFLGTGLWDDASTLSAPMLAGGWFAAPDPAARLDFERRYQQTFATVPPRLSTLAYDATALAAILARSDTTGHPYSRDRLTASRGFAGIDGVFRFRNDGLAERGLAVLEVRNGTARVIDPAPTAFASSGFGSGM